MTKISMQKSSFDIDNKQLFPVSGSFYQNEQRVSDSDDEEKKTINIDDPNISDSNMLESLSSSVFNYWCRRELKVNTDFELN